MSTIRLVLAGIVLVVWEMYAVDGIAVCCKYRGSNQNLYGGWGKIYRHAIKNNQVQNPNGTVIFSGEARFATIERTGQRVAFIQKSGRIAMVSVNGEQVMKEDLVKIPTGTGYLDWPEGDWLYYSHGGYSDDGSKIMKKINVATLQVKDVVTFEDRQWLWSIAADAEHAAIRPADNETCSGMGHVYRYLLPGGGKLSCNSVDDMKPGATCGSAISPQGEWIMFFTGTSHNEIVFKSWDKSESFTYNTGDFRNWGSDAGKGFNRNRWSCNSEKWICTMQGWDGRSAGKGSNQVLYDWIDKEQIVVTNNPQSSDKYQAEAGDFWIDNGATAAHPLRSAINSGSDAYLGDNRRRYDLRGRLLNHSEPLRGAGRIVLRDNELNRRTDVHIEID
ncbi:MAG: hypothetical protein GF398_00410 [Chitinivibrionales bacterium]|nr:hypothetical protein [Chitinivibrionales bacterium]